MIKTTKSRLGRGLGNLILKGLPVSQDEKSSNEPTKSFSSKKKPKSSRKQRTIPLSKKENTSLPGEKIKLKRSQMLDDLGAIASSQPDSVEDDSFGRLEKEYFLEIGIDLIDVNPYQPRKDISEERVRELSESIRAEGLLQPIIVRKLGKRYQLIAGERRWRACQFLKLKKIPARIMNASDTSSAVLAMIENLQREGLNPIEEALGYASLMRDFDLTQEGVKDRVGKPRATIANALRLLQLSEEVQGYLSKGILSVGHAKVLLGLEEDADQVLLARKIIENGWSVRLTEQRVKSLKTMRSRDAIDMPISNRSLRGLLNQSEKAVLNDLEKKIGNQLSTRVQVSHSAKKGKIIIDYYGNDDLERILERIGVS